LAYWFSGPVSLDGAIDASDQTAFACDLDGAVTEHLDRVPAFTGPIRQYGNDRPSGMIAECLIDLVANGEFGSHEESSGLQALPPVRLK
jgi:hypothetical protein